MPQAVAVMVSLMDDPDPRTRGQAAGYILDRVLGKAVPSTKPPPAEDDEPPPLTEGNAREIAKNMFRGVSSATLEAIRELVVSDLREKGRIVEIDAASETDIG